jgi:hypothetical protein
MIMKSIVSFTRLIQSLLVGSLIFLGVSLSISLGHAHALSGSDFSAGRIIDDFVFTDNTAISVQQIQDFFNAKVPTCDTNGSQSKSYYYNSSTGRVNNSADTWVTTSRAVYGQRYDSWNSTTIAAAPYVCLKNYIENPTTHANNLQNPGASIDGGQTAAQIIYNAAQTSHINPEVLIVTLQKEQGLVTDDWPWTSEYQKAMGYACPDTAPCNSQYFGFANQVTNAAAQFRRYLNNPNNYNFVVGNNTVPYNPNASCGGSVVNIQDQSTAGLYDYTPYQPNAAALRNLSDSSAGGTGDSCSAYGNRNFWWYFNTWFGSTTRFNGSIVLQSAITLDKSTYYKGDTVHASYIIANNSDISVDVGTVGICARINGQNYDFGTASLSMNPRSTYTVSYSRTLDQNGVISVFVCSYNSTLGGWVGDYYPYANDSTARQRDAFVYDNPLVSSNLSISPSAPTLFQPVTVTFTLQNSSSNPITIPAVGVAVRDPNGNNVGYPGDSNVTIAANSSYTYSKTKTFISAPGTYRFWITSLVNNAWNDNYPSSSSGIARTLNTTIYDNPLITSGITLSPSTPTLMQPVTASFTVQNNSSSPVTIPAIGIAVRDSLGNNVGYPGDSNVTIPANGSYTYSKTRTFTSNSGAFRFWVTSLINNSWNDNYPAGGPSTSRNLLAAVYDNPLMTSGLTFSPSTPGLNQNVTVSFTINNYSSSPVTIPAIGVAVRDPNGNNVGYPGDSNVTIPANGSYTYSKTRTFTGPAGTYRFWVTSFINNTWNDNYPAYGPGAIRNTTKQLN